jgi:hypothetical protein
VITPEQIRIFCRILNAFENDSGSPETDYKSVYVYSDGTTSASRSRWRADSLMTAAT